MKWKEPDDDLEKEIEPDGSYEEEYSPLKTGHLDIGSRLASIVTRPGSWIVAVLFIVIVLLFVFIRTGNGDKAMLSSVEQRLQQLENRLNQLEGMTNKINDTEEFQKAQKALMVRLDRVETSMAKKLDEMGRQVKQLKSQTQKTSGKSSPKPSKETGTSNKGGGTHVVKKGETLYSISKQYGLSVAQLRSINKLSENAAIFPGQTLKITR